MGSARKTEIPRRNDRLCIGDCEGRSKMSRVVPAQVEVFGHFARHRRQLSGNFNDNHLGPTPLELVLCAPEAGPGQTSRTEHRREGGPGLWVGHPARKQPLSTVPKI